MALRRWINTQIREIQPEQRAEWSQQVIRQLMERTDWLPESGSVVVALFGGLKLEVDVMPLFAWLQERGCRIALFESDPHTGEMRPWLVQNYYEMRQGQMGVLEPVPEAGRELSVADLSIVLTPGLAFDRETGQRMGRGRGHYDRLFASTDFKGTKIGVGFELQVISNVPIEPHDQPLHYIVTEKGWRDFTSTAEA